MCEGKFAYSLTNLENTLWRTEQESHNCKEPEFFLFILEIKWSYLLE